MDAEIAEQLARRNRLLRRRWQQMSYGQRMEEMQRLQQRMWDTLRSSPGGYAHFLRRNFKSRAIDVPSIDVPSADAS